MRGTLSSIFLSLLLVGCAHTQPGIKIQTVEVPVIHTQKCIKKEDIPAKPASLSKTTMPSNISDVARLALAKVSEWTRYGNKADLVFKACEQGEINNG